MFTCVARIAFPNGESLMTKIILTVMVLGGCAAFALHSLADEPTITQDELVRRTQELFDSIVPGQCGTIQEIFCR